MSIRVTMDILNQNGCPAFYSDIFANRPSPGFIGRIFISINTAQIFYDNGTNWVTISAS
jgi:hypothetical protein